MPNNATPGTFPEKKTCPRVSMAMMLKAEETGSREHAH